MSPFRRLDYDWLVPELGLLTEMWSHAITHSHGGNNLSKEGSELHLQYGVALSRPWQIWNEAIPLAETPGPWSKYETNKPNPLVLSAERIQGHWSHAYSRSAEQDSACNTVTEHDWKQLCSTPTLSTAWKKPDWMKSLVLSDGRSILVLQIKQNCSQKVYGVSCKYNSTWSVKTHLKSFVKTVFYIKSSYLM